MTHFIFKELHQTEWTTSFLDRLRELGWVQGHSVSIPDVLNLNLSEWWRSSMMTLVLRVPAAAKGRSQFNVGRHASLLALVLLAGAFTAAVPSVRSSLVYTENLDPAVMVMKSTQNRV
jgi:hypothetical protein